MNKTIIISVLSLLFMTLSYLTTQGFLANNQPGGVSPSPEIATLYSQGLEAYNEEDYAKAAEQWLKAAEEGHAGAQYGVANLYANGQGVAQNDSEAVSWYREAAEQGMADAQYTLGVLYMSGVRVPQDIEEAYFWISLSTTSTNEHYATVKEQLEVQIPASRVAAVKERVEDWVPSSG